MSLLWRDELTVLLSPGQVWLRRVPRGVRRPALAQVISCDAGDARAWRGAVATFADAATGGSLRGARVTFVLSNHFVRYGMVPACEDLDEAEYAEFARHQLARLYGSAARDWVLRINPGAARDARLASGVAPELLNDVAEAAQEAGMTLVSIQPQLMAVFNANRKTIGAECAWLALAEPGRNVVALRQGDRWQGVWSGRSGADWDADLLGLLDRARFLSEGAEDARTVYLCTSRLIAKTLPARPWHMKELPAWPASEAPPERQDAPTAT